MSRFSIRDFRHRATDGGELPSEPRQGRHFEVRYWLSQTPERLSFEAPASQPV